MGNGKSSNRCVSVYVEDLCNLDCNTTCLEIYGSITDEDVCIIRYFPLEYLCIKDGSCLTDIGKGYLKDIPTLKKLNIG